MLSGAVKRINYNISSYSVFAESNKPYIYSNLSLGIPITRQIVFTPQVQYEYTQNKIISYKGNVEKSIKGFGSINAYYEENIPSDVRFVGLGCRMDLSFAQVGLLAIASNLVTTINENANGSFIFDKNKRKLYPTNRTSVGKGGLTIAPFLDLNSNGIKDETEPKAEGLKLTINGGRMEYPQGDTIIQIFDLEPYTSYFVKVQPSSFDNISWSVKNKSLKVIVDPNNLKVIEIPVAVSAELSGSVFKMNDEVLKGIGKIVVQVYTNNDSLVAKTLSEADGFFYILGLLPGEYKVQIDPIQLKKLNLESQTPALKIVVKNSVEGDVISGLEFMLKEK
ncbi:MAG: carboxypeptidase regulatory-like domain-containing protein [Bacteroidetes bacterium]|nr:carboxypeptidase regulatory-like domain-containing protein [Bacteroidota bacterium]